MDKLDKLEIFVRNMRKELEKEQENAYEKSVNAATYDERIKHIIEEHQCYAAIRALFKISEKIQNLKYN